ncbi:MAG: hypothetical protein AAFU85_03165 [Planctomycetota bacterium]
MKESILQVARRADAFFSGKSPIHETMRRLARVMGEMKLPFAVAGAMAANAHGHTRTTADVNIILRREDLARFKDRHLGLGWVDKFEGSKNFRDAVTNVSVDVLLTGEYPGDGLRKPIAFPEPETVTEVVNEEDGIPYISLQTLIELKLTSGMTTDHRPRDLDDVIQLIKVNELPRGYAEEIHAYVRSSFLKMWQAAQVNEDY